jgi:uncharacterized delta-60 repeat protein
MKKLLLIKLILFSIIINLGFIAYAQPGSIDSSINYPSSCIATSVIAIQTDGKIIRCECDFHRLNIDGSIDTTFNGGTCPSCLSIQSNGKIIIGGQFTSYNGVARNGIARLNTDGSLDTTFNVGTGIVNLANSNPAVVITTAIQSDGKIIIGGQFTSYNGISRNGIARLNTDGSIDTTFNVGSGISNIVNNTTILYSTLIQSDGKIIIGGQFTSYNGISRKSIARLNTDGSLDATFDPGSGTDGNNGNSEIYTMALQNDGKIIIGGHFTSINGIARVGIARINSDGSIDPTFDPGTGVLGVYNSCTSPSLPGRMLIQNDGKIIIGGQFTCYNGIARKSVARLNSDGSLDATFDPGSGTGGYNGNSGINTMALQSDGKIIIGGQFTTYNGIARNNLARINGGNILSNNTYANSALIIFPNPVKNILNIQTSNDTPVTSCRIVDVLGKIIVEQNQNNNTINTETLSKGIYILEVYSENEKFTNKFVKE